MSTKQGDGVHWGGFDNIQHLIEKMFYDSSGHIQAKLLKIECMVASLNNGGSEEEEEECGSTS